MAYTDDLAGTVISVNTTFGNFEVEDNIKVHMGIILAQGKIKKLPLIGSKVVIKNGDKTDLNYVVCESSILEGNFETDCPWNPLLNLIKTFKLGPDDIVELEKISKEIEDNFTDIDSELKKEILPSLLENLILLTIKNKEHLTLNKTKYNNCIVSKVSLTTVRTCRYVEINSNKYVDFPYWSFGSHPSEKNKMLFGYLEIHPVYGFHMVKDNNYQLALVIITENCKKSSTEILHLQNSYVLIEKYNVMTEIFKESEVPNIEYIITKLDDIHIIHSRNEINNIFGVKLNEMEYPNVITFELRKKSSVCVGSPNTRELFLEVFINFNSTGFFLNDIYLVLPSKYICISSYLREGSLYKMYYKTQLKIVKKIELTRIKDLKIYEIPDQGCFFQPVSDGISKISEPLSLPKCKSHIENSNDLVTFRGVIKSKRFANSYSSRTTKIPAVYGFGTPGGKVHQLVFRHDDNQMILDCYLNNWENTLMPLGLVPEMEVIVRHVIPQSKKYVKSTIFTSFELTSYKPSSNFSTTNLYKNCNIEWGVPIFLSQGHKVPVDVLVWGRVHSIFILKLSIASLCVQCKHTINDPKQPHPCSGTEREIKFEAKFNALDQRGQSSTITKSLEVLRVLLNLNSDHFQEWIASFHVLGSYSYNFFDGSSPICEDFTKILKKFHHTTGLFDVKCRKTAAVSSQTQRTSWYCTEIRNHDC